MFKEIYSMLKRDGQKIFYLFFVFFTVCWLFRVMGTFYLRDLLLGNIVSRYIFITAYNLVQISCLGLLAFYATQSKMKKWPVLAIFCVVTLLTRLPFFLRNVEFLTDFFVGGIGGKIGYFLYVFSWDAFFDLPVLIFWSYLLFKEGYTQKISQGLLKILVFYVLGTLWNCFVSSAQCDTIQLLRDTPHPFVWGIVHNPIYGLVWNTIYFAGYVLILYFLTAWVKSEKDHPRKKPKKATKKK